MTEAVEALLAYCFEELAVHRVEALIHPDNAASIALAERLGFRCEGGPLRDYWRVGDRYMSVMLYALLGGSGAEPGLVGDAAMNDDFEVTAGRSTSFATSATPMPMPST